MSMQAKATARRFLEEQDRSRSGPADELCADGYTAYLAGFPPMDLEGHKRFSAPFYAAFPDLKHRIEEVVAEGDRVVVRFRLTGTNTESFMDNPASGKPIEVEALALMTVASGKVIEIRSQFDRMGLLQQIGGAPRPVGVRMAQWRFLEPIDRS